MANNSNYYAGDNTNPDFTTGNNTVQGQQGGMAVGNGGGQPFDIIQWLQSAIKGAQTPNQTGSTQGGMAVAEPNPYQEGVNKALKEQGYNHASQAVQSGVNPNDIVNHPMMQPSKMVANMASTAQKSRTQPQQQPNPTPVPPSIDDQISTINKQAQLNLAKQNLAQSKPPDFLQRFNQQFTKMAGGQTQGETLTNIEAMQKIAGGEPLQQKDVGDLNANTYHAALEATNQSASLEAQKLPALIDLYGKLQATRGIGPAITGTASAEQNKVISALSLAGQNLNTHIANLSTLIKNRPTFTSKGMNSPAQDTMAKVKQGQVGKYSYR